MVKEDCEQFQKPRGHANDKIINWRYVKAKTEEEEMEEKRKEEEYEIEYIKYLEKQKEN